ncbi:hypothetical protein [Moraxella sp. VT-16-12]|uniref:hypothetical protein n=1 Tax=Moraxella sp. VT-16-12 TaxID=2014877 RepID=UPI000B7EF9BC|nr:hypothetical protein [Moraxella sp. VT-16-12]TWV83972.1 hypothetical protein CEW93_002235 [Moraxella sp. VT-16-12]
MILKPTAKTTDPNLNIEQVRLECKEMVKSRAKISAGVAIIPVPFLDVAIDVAMLSKLLPEISARFGLEDGNLSETERQQNLTDRIMAISGLVATRGVVNQTVKGFGTRIVGKQIAKYVPLGGQIVAGTLGYIIFKKIADDHIETCYKIAKDARKV